MPGYLKNRIEKVIPSTTDRTVTLQWEIGVCTVFDLAPLIAVGGAFAVLADASFFAKVVVGRSGQSINWPEDIDLDADTLWFAAHPEDDPLANLKSIEGSEEKWKWANNQRKQHLDEFKYIWEIMGDSLHGTMRGNATIWQSNIKILMLLNGGALAYLSAVGLKNPDAYIGACQANGLLSAACATVISLFFVALSILTGSRYIDRKGDRYAGFMRGMKDHEFFDYMGTIRRFFDLGDPRKHDRRFYLFIWIFPACALGSWLISAFLLLFGIFVNVSPFARDAATLLRLCP